MKGLVGSFLRDKYRIPPMSLAEILFGLGSMISITVLITIVLL
jgi:hypothetical protein